ncbi:MAG TPA: gamma-glutamyltransferase, partial [Pseudogracilibacillus sp.]|nr:gamma-glutamyltransferase [Pseudogracilibacillus sp.]
MIFMNEEETIAIGTPGGSRIPEILAQVIQTYLANGDLAAAVEQPRISVLNDKVAFEDYIAPEISTQLEDNDYRVSVNTSLLFFGGINAIGKQDANIVGAADERRHGILLISE